MRRAIRACLNRTRVSGYGENEGGGKSLRLFSSLMRTNSTEKLGDTGNIELSARNIDLDCDPVDRGYRSLEKDFEYKKATDN